MLSMSEIKEWAKKLQNFLSNFEIMDEDEDARIVILQNMGRFIDRWIVRQEDSTLYKFGL